MTEGWFGLEKLLPAPEGELFAFAARLVLWVKENHLHGY